MLGVEPDGRATAPDPRPATADGARAGGRRAHPPNRRLHGAGPRPPLSAGSDAVAGEAVGPSVAVMSWSYGPSDVLVPAVEALVDRGLAVVPSAGDTGGDDCGVAPGPPTSCSLLHTGGR